MDLRGIDSEELYSDELRTYNIFGII